MEKPIILYEDKQILVTVKEAGMAVQSASIGQMDMESQLKSYLAATSRERIPYLGIVHRLDQPVEGIVVFAKTKKAAADLSRQITTNTMEKWYLAVAEKECIPGDEGSYVDYLIKDKQMARISTSSDAAAKKAVLDYRILAAAKGSSLLQICLHTGRFHQIRCQLSQHGMPIAGDIRYGATKEKQKKNIALCAFRLSFMHPETKKKMQFVHCPDKEAFAEYRKEIAALKAENS